MELAVPVRRVIPEPLAARDAAALAAAERPVVVGGAVLVEVREATAAGVHAEPCPDVAEAADGIALRVCVCGVTEHPT